MRREAAKWCLTLGLLVLLGLVPPDSGQTREEGVGRYYGQREQLINDLNLSPDKSKDFLTVEGRWDQLRQGLIATIKKNEKDLAAALAAPQPDEGRIDRLVNTLVAAHDQLFETFKSQRQEEMTLLTPVQRGKFLLALKKWHEEQMCK